MRFTILALLFTLSASASSPEYLVGGAVPAAATRHRSQPAVATDGTDYFAVWTDQRSGFEALTGTRVTSEGQVLDPLGIRFGTGNSAVYAPQVAWDGAAYLVVWTESTQGEYSGDRSIHAARIAPDGRMVMQPRLVVADAATDEGTYLASNGNVSVIVYEAGFRGLRIAVLDRDGNTLRDEALPAPEESNDHPAIAASTTGFAVAWNTNAGFATEGETIQAVLLTATGHVSGEPIVVGRGEHPAIATDGTRFTITAYRNMSWQEFILVSRTFDASLTAIGGERELLNARQHRQASVVWTGANYEVITLRQLSLNSAYEIVSIALDRDGNPQPLRTRGPALGDPFRSRISVATNGTDVVLVRPIEGGARVRTQIFAQRYPGNATNSTAPSLLSWSGNSHRDPSIAASAFGHLVAWVEDGGTYATRVDRNGNSLDGRGLLLTDFSYGFARAAFDGTNYVVAWRESGFIGVRAIAPLTGATVAEAKIAVEGFPELALAASPEATYVAFTEERIRLARIPHATFRPDPAPLDVSPEDTGELYVAHPALSWNGSALLVVWNENVNSQGDPPVDYSVNVVAARVTPGLTLLDPAPVRVAEANEENAEYSYSPASVASSGTDWLVVTSLNDATVVGRRVLENGSVRGNAPVKIGDGMQPVVGWEGTRYAVAWKEGEYWDPDKPVVVAAVPEFGAVAALSRTVVANRTASIPLGSRPSIASAGNGSFAIAYTRVSHRPEHAGVERSFFRVMDFSQRGRVIRR